MSVTALGHTVSQQHCQQVVEGGMAAFLTGRSKSGHSAFGQPEPSVSHQVMTGFGG